MPIILLLDDNQVFRDIAAEAMTRAGYTVCTASDGRGVDELVRRNAVDLVITDLVMPERDGIETVRALRRSHPDLPIIAISGDAPANASLYLSITRKLGALQTLQKPFTIEMLLATIRQVLASSASGRAQS